MAIKGIEENFKFIVLEVTRQVEDTRKLLLDSRPELSGKINSRDDYIDNLKNVIETKCFNFRARTKPEADYIRAMDVITSNLEKIGDYTVTIVKQTTFLTKPDFVLRYDLAPFFKDISAALKIVNSALLNRDMRAALKICRSEVKIDEHHKIIWERVIADLKIGGEEAENYVTCLFLSSNLERIGDALLNIGEAIMSTVLGEKLKIHQFDSFQGAVESSQIKVIDTQRPLKAMGETKSGCVIDRVATSARGADHGQGVIFKEGDAKKIIQEKKSIEEWNDLFPGLAPKIFGFHQSGRYGSLLIEFLRGGNLRDIILTGNSDLLKESMLAVTSTVKNIWIKTKTQSSSQANYIKQMKSRIEDVYTVHPSFRSSSSDRIGDLLVPSFEELSDQANHYDNVLKSPFSVRIHGDFNIDNLMYDPSTKKVHYIDLYRSSMSDYLQDVSVFLISNFRTPVFDKTLRRRLNWATIEFYEFAKKFSDDHDDQTFHARLALGLARSLITSTRFEFNEDFAHVMYMRAVYLLEKLIGHEGQAWEKFKIPEDVLVY